MLSLVALIRLTFDEHLQLVEIEMARSGRELVGFPKTPESHD